MILKAFSLLDTKVQTFSPPFFLSHLGHAARAVSQLGQDLNTTVGRHPADFMLYEIGEFDDQTGGLMPSAVPVNHGPVLAFIPQARQPGLLDIVPESGPAVSVGPMDDRELRGRAGLSNGHAG